MLKTGVDNGMLQTGVGNMLQTVVGDIMLQTGVGNHMLYD